VPSFPHTEAAFAAFRKGYKGAHVHRDFLASFGVEVTDDKHLRSGNLLAPYWQRIEPQAKARLEAHKVAHDAAESAERDRAQVLTDAEVAATTERLKPSE